MAVGQTLMKINGKASLTNHITYFNNNFENQMSNYTIAALQGNHDSETFEGHLRHPSTLLTASDNSSSAEHKLTYSF